MRLSKLLCQTRLIKVALSNLVQKNKLKALKNFKGRVELVVDLSALRRRNKGTG
jgi:hypothetical protein